MIEPHEHLGDLESLPVERAEGFDRWHREQMGRMNPSEPVQPEPGLSTAARRLLRAVIANPGLKSSAYPKLAGISPAKAKALRQMLIEQGYLREHKITASARGRSTIVLEPLPPAHEAVEKDDGP